LFLDKLKSKWLGPYEVIHVFPYGVLELRRTDGRTFKVNGQRAKNYEDGSIEERETFLLNDPVHNP